MKLASLRMAFATASLLVLAGCNSESGRYPARAYAPIPGDTLALFQQKNTDRNAPVLIRAYKKESEIEVWKQAKDGRYVHVKTYPVCRWSGQLGPKKREGDRQVPEGFYTVTAAQMNPTSAYWLSFNVGYPNPMERQLGRTGGDIMVHGTCSSRGCFAMTNEQIEEIYAVMREALNGGQKQVQFQSYPFRMTAENMAKFRHDPNIAFWKNLKEGSDHFEVTKLEPKVGYCGSQYTFDAIGGAPSCASVKVDPQIASLVAEKRQQDDAKVAELVQKGTPAIRVAYADGGQHASFRNTGYANADSAERIVQEGPARSLADLGDVSRPEAVNQVEEYAVNEKGERKDAAAKVETAKAEPARPAPVLAAAAAKPAAEAPAKTVSPTLPGGAVALAPAQPATSLNPGGGALQALGSFFGSAKPTPAGTATAAGPAPVAAAASTEAKPFYKRWLSIGSGEDAATTGATPSATPAADADPAAPLPAKVPLPPKRQAAGPEQRSKVALVATPGETAGQ
ncbi:MAG: murein L,D-transpeptidase family protein [Alsobacter sp.]